MRQTQQHPIKLSAFDPKENDAINAVGQDQAIEISADISRRAFVLGAGVAALSGLAAPAFVAERKHEHPSRDMSLIDAAYQCMKTAGTCMSHCRDMFNAGDSLEKCALIVGDVVMVCSVIVLWGAVPNEYSHVRDTDAKNIGEVCADLFESLRRSATNTPTSIRNARTVQMPA